MRKPPENVLELPIVVRAQMAMAAAFEWVTEEHARMGLPIWTTRDGKVVAIPAEELLEIARQNTGLQ